MMWEPEGSICNYKFYKWQLQSLKFNIGLTMCTLLLKSGFNDRTKVFIHIINALLI